MYNNNMLYIPIVVSSTGKSLWENSFDDVFIKRLYNEIPNASIKRMESDVSRHDARLIHVFKSVYGSECMGCEFARFEYIKYYYAESYRIKRIECYKGIYFPEYVEIDKIHFIIVIVFDRYSVVLSKFSISRFHYLLLGVPYLDLEFFR